MTNTRNTPTEVLEQLYQLSTAEAELVQLLSRGFSLDEVAAEFEPS